jgi:hypothetical protein
MEKSSNKHYCQHGIAKIGAEVLNLRIGILMDSSAEMNIWNSNTPTSAIPKRYTATLKRHPTINQTYGILQLWTD